MPFQKGHKKIGGRKPGSRNKTYGAIRDSIKSEAQKHGPEIIEELWRIISAKDKRDRHVYDIDPRLKAMTLLLERGYGRPAQEITMTVKKDIDDYSDAELAVIAGVSLEDSSLGTDPAPEEGPSDPHQLH